MTAPVIAPNPASPFDTALRLVCLLYTLRIAELEQQLQDATDALTGCRRSCETEQADHQMTRLLGRDHAPPARRDLSVVVGGASHRHDGQQWTAGGAR